MQHPYIVSERWAKDPLYCALEVGNLHAARAMLKKRTKLSWYETAMYAPLAFHRPIWLLRQILDLGPKRQVFCGYRWVRPGGGWNIQVCATLLVAAAALDDLLAVEELIQRGYSQDDVEIYRLYHPYTVPWSDNMQAWYREMRLDHNYGVDLVWLEPEGYTSPRDMNYPYELITDCDPLSAAIWCGAARCVERLLPEDPNQLSLSARNALSWGPLPEDEARRQAVEDLVCRKYGQPLEELLTPGEFRNRDSPLFLPCLKRHLEWFSPTIASQFIECSVDGEWTKRAQWAWDALPLIPEHLMAEVVLEELRRYDSDLRKSSLEGAFQHPLVHLSVDRCAIPNESNQRQVLAVLEHMDITGEAPEGGLSGLAVAVLNALLKSRQDNDDLSLQCRNRLPKHPKVLHLLETEDPAMVRTYLYWKAEQDGTRYEDIYWLMTILGLKEETSYEL